ncbi:SDR family NAD(P)-dependent oxidoreductase [Actibacterium sp. 188UL27-1]|uniref:SDR family NAD(P)-dependent oxidoreductase n=1 Tax=Actibacterium sp. 188UL27-1 TaxID=2786961 RepID=UPI0019587FE8|nr:SDR family oxidoreductase [Actibacterium sp. 188UL27-1]MBM7067199.1 SDR family oxidoreductase [Actibacterium sp. 188UL27-1]
MMLAGQRALVTGAARGIGAATACALAEAGATVISADLDDASDTASATNGQAIQVDVSDETSVAAMFDVAGPLDCVVNAAGILIECPTLDMSVAEFDRQIAVNLRGSFLVAQGALKALSPRGQGRLILIASELAHLGRANFAAYCASKAGVIGLTRALAHEFAPDILVNAIAPGPTDTRMLSAETMSAEALALETQNPMGRIGTPDEIAATALFLAGPGASFMTGQTLCPSGGAVML